MTSRSTTLENLSAGTSYQVRVRAVSDVGAGPYSDVGTLSTYRGNHMTKSLTIMWNLTVDRATKSSSLLRD